ncbi:MAG: lysophospholipid acyltransferase family protein [Elusimicrobia bacterium]|nr:lysophospholipid acyltransferase family protein [Elusimicrobiota bacterium]
MTTRFSWRSVVPYVAAAYLLLVGLTTRLKVEGQEHRDALRRAKKRFIYVFWHQRQVFFVWSHRGEPVSILVSRSKDGEMIARTMSLFSIKAARGSSSRGAVAGLRELEDALDSGLEPGFTPDGPKGPARHIKPGALYLAQKNGAVILPITNALSRKIEFKKSWDRFQAPLPFGRAAIRYGAPIEIGPNDDLEKKASEVKAALDRITEEAERSLAA